jgi:hypothetical protein
MTTGCTAKISESMASISMTSHIRGYVQSLADEHCDDEWLRLCERLGSLKKLDFKRFKVLTAEYERHCLSMMHITTYNNSWTLSPEHFWTNAVKLRLYYLWYSFSEASDRSSLLAMITSYSPLCCLPWTKMSFQEVTQVLVRASPPLSSHPLCNPRAAVSHVA